MKRIFWAFLLLCFAVTPAAAQSNAPIDWIPADFSAFVRLDLRDAQTTLRRLNLFTYIGAVMQPGRIRYSQAVSYDSFFPLGALDVPGASFTSSMLPWLGDEVVIAYRTLDSALHADAADTLLILPTPDGFQAANRLRPIINAQDLLQRTTYRDVNVYIGDQTSFAFAPGAVLIGREDVLHAALDTMIGDAPALTASPTYQAVRASLPDASLPDAPLVLAYGAGDAAARAFRALASGGDTADPIFEALSSAIEQAVGENTTEQMIISGALDGVGVSVSYDSGRTSSVHAQVALHTTTALPTSGDTAFDSSVLNLIPRSAMIVQSGADAATAAAEALYTVPLLNFAGGAFGAFPLDTPPINIPLPTGDDVGAAVRSFLSIAAPTVNVEQDLLAQFDGSYWVAVLPRPNDPLPGLNLPVDLLIVAQATDADAAAAAQASIGKLTGMFGAPLADETLGDYTFSSLSDAATRQPIFRVGAVDNLLIVGTGSAAQQALDARRGDNRLAGQDRWEGLAGGERLPFVYIDVNAYYNTFFPTAGGQSDNLVGQVGIYARPLDANLYQLDVVVMLTA